MLLPLQQNNLLEGAGAATAVVTGTASDGMTEAEVVDGQSNLLLEVGDALLLEDGSQLLLGDETIIITLTGDTWVAEGATFNAQRQAILNGLDSNLSETTGWNAEVRDKQPVTSVYRTSDTVVTISLAPAPAYDITADEVITVTVPATAVDGGSAITATPTFTITADEEVAAETAVTGRSRGRKRYVVELDGQLIEVASISEVEAVLAHTRELADLAAERDVVSDATPKPPKVKVKTISGNVTTSQVIQRDVKRTQKAINQAYIEAARKRKESQELDRQISQALQTKLIQEDEDDAILVLLL